MTYDQWLTSLFSAIDARDSAAFADHLADDVEFQFGNLPVIRGAETTQTFVSGFFGSIRGLDHRLAEHWLCSDGTIVCRGVVTYERLDGSSLAVPFANIMKVEGHRAKEYRIFGDVSQLFGP